MSEEKGVRERSLEPRREARKTRLRESVRRAWRAPELGRCLAWGARLALGLVLAAGRVLGRCSPFGLALVGACGPGAGGFAALLGAVGGYLLRLGPEEALRYAACSILVFAVSFAFYDLSFYKKAWFMPLAAACLNLLTGLVTPRGQLYLHSAATFSTLAAEGVLTALGVYAFRAALALLPLRREAAPSINGAALAPQEAETTRKQQLCLALLALALLISLAAVKLAGTVSLGRLLALWLTLWAGNAAGAGGGAAVGLCTGLAMDLVSQDARIYAITFAFSGLTGGLFRKNGRFVSTLCCVISGAAAALWGWEQADPVAAVAELAVAGGLFLATPQRLLDRCTALFSNDRAPAAAYAGRAAQRQLQDTASAFAQVFSALKSAFSAKASETAEDPSVIYDRAANKVCASCALRERCWQSQYQDTHDQLNAVLPHLLDARSASPSSLPQRFRDRCVRLGAFSAAVNEELRAYLLRRQYGRQVDRSRQAVCRQYAQVAEVLEDAAAAMAAPYTLNALKTRRLSQFLAGRDLRCQGAVYTDERGRLSLLITGTDAAAVACAPGVSALSSVLACPLVLVSAPTEEDPRVLLRQQEPLTATVGVSGRKREENTVSGDICSWFKDDSGQLYLLLCDGMGTGREARQESELAADLLEKLLKAGFTPENALKTLDQTFCLRLDEGGGFSTVDLLALDLFSGLASLYKLGSAPSYLRQGGTVRALRAKGLPAGFSPEDGGAANAGPVSMRLGPGDCLILLTDGVFEDQEEDDGRLRELLMRFEGESPAALAEQIVAHGDGSGDDKTALVLRLGLRCPGEFSQDGKAAV